MDERERFEELLEALDELAEANRETPILVEGKRDVAALRDLGCRGEVMALNQGRNLFVLCEDLGRSTNDMIVLTDWDRKGGILLDQITNGLAANGVKVDIVFRDRLRRAMRTPVKDVESLPNYVRRRLQRYHKTTLEERARNPLHNPHRHGSLGG